MSLRSEGRDAMNADFAQSVGESPIARGETDSFGMTASEKDEWIKKQSQGAGTAYGMNDDARTPDDIMRAASAHSRAPMNTIDPFSRDVNTLAQEIVTGEKDVAVFGNVGIPVNPREGVLATDPSPEIALETEPKLSKTELEAMLAENDGKFAVEAETRKAIEKATKEAKLTGLRLILEKNKNATPDTIATINARIKAVESEPG